MSKFTLKWNEMRCHYSLPDLYRRFNFFFLFHLYDRLCHSVDLIRMRIQGSRKGDGDSLGNRLTDKDWVDVLLWIFERQLADLLISKHKLMAIRTEHTHAGWDTHTVSDNCVSDFSASQRRICRPKRNKQICHFLLFSKTDCLSINLMCHILCVNEFVNGKRGVEGENSPQRCTKKHTIQFQHL